jgi:exosortase
MRADCDERARYGRGHLLLAAGLLTGAVAADGSAWADIVRLGLKDEESQYVLLAPLVIIWLAWVRRSRLVYCRPGNRSIGVVMMAVGWAAWSIGYRRSVPTLWHGGPVLTGLGAIVSVLGADVLRHFLPAVLALLFLIPITPTRRQIISAPMEAYAASWTQATCQLLGLNVTRSGNLLSVNGVSVEVAEACNGMRQVVTFWLVSYVLLFSRAFRWYARVAGLLAVPVVAIAINVVRLVPTVWVYSYGGGVAAERFHDMAGWIMLLLAMGLGYAVVGALAWATVPLRRYQRALTT